MADFDFNKDLIVNIIWKFNTIWARLSSLDKIFKGILIIPKK